MFGHRMVAQVGLRHLERMPLGTPYPEVVERVRELTRNPQLAGRCQLAVDATGVGAPWRQRRVRGSVLLCSRLQCGGHAAVGGAGVPDAAGVDQGGEPGDDGPGGGALHGAEAGPDHRGAAAEAGAAGEQRRVRGSVPLRSRLEWIASRLKGVEALVKEMAEMQVKVTASRREQYGAWREGQHDDMILAVALACWAVKKQYPRPLSGAYCGR